MLVRATTQNYNRIAAELITELAQHDRAQAGNSVQDFFAGQMSDASYWPDDEEVLRFIADLPIYRRLRRGRLRMVLEAVEDHLRGWVGEAEGSGGERVTRGKFHIEHIMPRSWHTHWPLSSGVSEPERDHVIHTLGNLTLLTKALNSKVSMSAWPNKREALKQHDVLHLNRKLLDKGRSDWSEETIRDRTAELTNTILAIWPVPAGHRSPLLAVKVTPQQKVGLADLIGAGLLEIGTILYVRQKAHSQRTATVLADGRIDVDGIAFDSPSGAAKSIVKGPVNGWTFFRLDPTGDRSLNDLYQHYVAGSAEEVEDEDESETMRRASWSRPKKRVPASTRKPHRGGPSRAWDRPSFLAELESNRGQLEAAAAARVLDWCNEHGLVLRWGRGSERGSFSPKFVNGATVYNLMTVWSWAGEIQIQFGSMHQPPFDHFDRKREFADRLEAVPGSREFPDDRLDKWPTIRIGRLVEAGGVDRFLEIWDWYLDQLHP